MAVCSVALHHLVEVLEAVEAGPSVVAAVLASRAQGSAGSRLSSKALRHPVGSACVIKT